MSVIGKKTFDETYDMKDVMDEAEATLLDLSQKNMKKDYSVLAPVIGKAVKLVNQACNNVRASHGEIKQKFV